ncbi:MAG TPA: PepSY-associated TM helix domain-containing protein [Gemmatimonadales bacterium]|nr:PepSY-associated TM helix domain-containing protein [Gemmatimonadales bacterium]
MPQLRPFLVRWHRRLALWLSPVATLVLLSGAVLAFQPMLAPPPPATAPVDLTRVIELLRRVDPEDRAGAIAIDPAGPKLLVQSDTAPPKVYRLADGVEVPLEAPPGESGIFDIARWIHHQLWFGLGGLVTLASFGLLALVLAGPFLAPFRRPRSLLTWHAATGWVLWPLAVLLPLTAVLIVAPVGRPFGGSRDRTPVALPVALEQAAALTDLSALRFAQRMPNGGLFVITHAPGGNVRRMIRDGQVYDFGGRFVRSAHLVHTGEWGGIWGGVVALLAAILLLGLQVTGILSWWRRRR